MIITTIIWYQPDLIHNSIATVNVCICIQGEHAEGIWPAQVSGAIRGKLVSREYLLVAVDSASAGPDNTPGYHKT